MSYAVRHSDVESDYSKVYYSECETEQTPRSNTTRKTAKSRKQQPVKPFTHGQDSHTGSHQYQQRFSQPQMQEYVPQHDEMVFQQPAYTTDEHHYDQQYVQQPVYMPQQQPQMMQQAVYRQNHNVSRASLNNSNVNWIQEAGDMPSVELSRLSHH